MKLKYLVYMLSFLALMGMVSAGTYTEVNYNGMFKVAEVKSLNSKFIKAEKEELAKPESYSIETSFVMKPYAGYETCYRSNDEGCLTCKETLLNDGYGQVTNYVGAGKVKSTCARKNSVDGYSNSAFRENFISSSCNQPEIDEVNVETVTQFNCCGNYY